MTAKGQSLARSSKGIALEFQGPPEYRGYTNTEQLIERAAIEAEAWRLLETREQGVSPSVLRPERLDNARTALMEALTLEGHLSHIEISGSLEEINTQILTRLLNGWNDNLPTHEKQRRFAELCEELVIQNAHHKIITGELAPDTAIAVNSDYPDAMDSVTATSLGYRVKNRKGMVRSTHLRKNADGSYTRIIEQVSRSNGNWQTTFGFFAECGISTTQGIPDVVALATPYMYRTNEYTEGVVGIIRRLDALSGPGFRYGEHQHGLQVPYERLRDESQRRETQISRYTEQLAQLEEQLDELTQSGSMQPHEKDRIFKEQVDRILSAICTLSPSYAEATFGAASVVVFHEASNLVMQGRYEEAQTLINENQNLKETITFCGMSISIEEAKRQGLNINSYGELVEAGKNDWKWTQGVCRITSCPTRPSKTKIGPCEVCERCQRLFDKGLDPSKAAGFGGLIVELFKSKKPEESTEEKIVNISLKHVEDEQESTRELEKIAA